MAVREGEHIRFGPFDVDFRSGELFKDGTKLKLQPQPVQVLSILLEHPGELITREQLQQRLWPADTFVDFEQGLNTAVKKLRVALCDEAETPKYIETLPKRGYRFIGEVLPATQGPQPERLPATPPPQFQPPQASVRRARRWLWSATAAVLAILVIFLTYREFFPIAPRIVRTRQLTRTGLRKSLSSIATDGNRVYFVEQRAGDRHVLAQVSVEGGDVTDVPTHFKPNLRIRGISPSGSELLVADCCPGNMEHWIQPIPAGAPRRAPIPTDATGRWVWDGTLLYDSSDHHEVYRVNVDGTNRTRLFTAPYVWRSSLSPDGKRVRFHATRDTTGSRVDLMEAGIDGSNQHVVFPEMKGQTCCGGWTADGRLFYFVRRNGPAFSLWVAQEPPFRLPFIRSEPALLYAGPLGLISPVESRNKKELYVIGRDRRGELSVYDARSSSFVPYLGGISASYVAFSPDHQWIAYVAYPDGTLWKSRVDGSEKMQLTFPPMGVLLPRWSPDGKFIVFMDWYGSEHHAIYLVPSEGGQPKLLATGPLEPGDPTWSPDSRHIAYGGAWSQEAIAPQETHVEILDLNTMVSTKVPGSEGLFSPRWSPDGKYLVATTTPDSQLRLYAFEQKQWRSVQSGITYCGWPAWSHDSKFIYASGDNKIVRINIANDKRETVVNIGGIRWTSFALGFGGWFDLTPDDRILILRDTGSEEIYALELEY